MKLVVYTQHFENYGTAEQPRWKPKGGDDVIIARLTVQQGVSLGAKGIDALIEKARTLLDHDGEASREYVCDFEIIADDEPTRGEAIQLEVDEKITYPAEDRSAEIAAL